MIEVWDVHNAICVSQYTGLDRGSAVRSLAEASLRPVGLHMYNISVLDRNSLLNSSGSD